MSNQDFSSLKKNKNPVALVAGGAGFVGSYLCEALLSQNCQVICVDDLTTGTRKNLENLLPQNNFFFFEHDLNKSLPELPENLNYIFHLAGMEEYLNGVDVGMETLLVNSLGTRNLLEMARLKNSKFLLVSSCDIYAGVLSSLELKHYFGFNNRDTKRYSHHEAKRFSEALVTEYFKKFNLDARITRVTDVYGPRMDLEAGTEIARLLKETKTQDSLTIFGDGLKILHPTYVSDVVFGITKAMFAENTKGKIYNLVNPAEISVLNLAYEIQKQATHSLQKNLNINFAPQEVETRFPLHKTEITEAQVDLNWRAIINIQEGMVKTLAHLQVRPAERKLPQNEDITTKIHEAIGNQMEIKKIEDKSSQEESLLQIVQSEPVKTKGKNSDQSPKGQKSNWRFWLGTAFCSLIFFKLLLPSLSIIYHTKNGIDSLGKTAQLFKEFNLAEAKIASQKAEISFQQSKSTLSELEWIFAFLNLKSEKEKWEHLYNSGENLTQGAGFAINGLNSTFQTISSDSLPDENLSLKAVQLQTQLELADASLARAEAQLKAVNPESLKLAGIKDQLIKTAQIIPSLRQSLGGVRQAVSILPELVGSQKPRSYLVLFQNNQELRPTGGFIGSYAVLSFQGGKFKDLKVDDIYSIDGQLKESINPPKALAEHLGVNRWYLRDVGWNPDFTSSALEAESFFIKETNQKVDGVIALDLSLIKDLIDIVGSVNLPDYQENITKDNFFEKTEYYSEIGFFPGSTAKKNFLSALARSLFEKILNQKEDKWPQIFKVLRRNLDEKHLLFAFHQAEASKIIADQNWNGQIKNPEGFDYLMMVDANVGANKANYFLKRKSVLNVYLGKEGQVDEKLTINYDNQSPNETWPAGRYKNYLRLYLPLGAKLKNVEIEGEQKIIKVDAQEESGKTTIGFLVEVPVKSNRKVIVEWSSPVKLQFNEASAGYGIFIQKQPGTGNDLLSVIIDYPLYLQVVGSQPVGLATESAIVYNTELATDRQFNLQLKKRI